MSGYFELEFEIYVTRMKLYTHATKRRGINYGINLEKGYKRH